MLCLQQVERGDFKTTTPAETLAQVVAWLKGKSFDCLGVASFGPIELHRNAPKYGCITTTPKPGWRNVDVLGTVRKGLGLASDFPLGWDTDVNAPALAEYAQVRQEYAQVRQEYAQVR
jgi:fructokinase